MSSPPTPVTIKIFDKEYVVSCPPEEREALVESARILDRRMREARDGGKVIGTERMAVMAALNIVHELLGSRSAQTRLETGLAGEVQRLSGKVRDALGRRQRGDALD